MNLQSKSHVFILGTAIAVFIAALTAGAVYWQYTTISEQVSRQSLDAAQFAQNYLQQERVRHLEQLSKNIATNPSFVSYVAQALSDNGAATPTTDIASIRDIVDERRRESGLSVAAILDPEGHVLATSGDAVFSNRDLSTNPLVVQVKKSLAAASGIFDDDRHVPLTTITPLMRGPDVIALLLTAIRFDDASIKSMIRASNSELALVTLGTTDAHIVASTLDAKDTMQLAGGINAHIDQLRDQKEVAASPKTFIFNIDGNQWPARVSLLHLATSNVYLVLLLPPTHLQSIRDALAIPALIGFAIALFALLIAMIILWRGVIKPLNALGNLSDRAMRGDHALEFKVAGIRPVAHVARAFNYFLTELDRFRVPHGVPQRRVTDRK